MADRADQTLFVAIEWIENHCVVPDGFQRGRLLAELRKPPLTGLYDYQLRFFRNFYLVKGTAEWNPSDPLLAPAFVYRRGIEVGPQKIGKGPQTAAHCCLEGAGPALFAGWAGRDDGYACSDHGCECGWSYAYEPGEPMGMHWPTPLIQVTAVSEEQTDNIYGALRPMIDLGPLSDVIPRTGEQFIRLPNGGRIDTVTSSAQSRLGQRVTFVPQDEVGLWTPSNKMTQVADTQYRGLAGMGGRAALTTNAWDPSENSVAQQHFTSLSEDIYRQMTVAPSSLSYRNKAERRKIHRIVYEDALKPKGHVDLDAIEAEAADLLERDPAQAERFFGNRIVHGHGAWLPDGLWETQQADEPQSRSDICLGFDGSVSDDWTALRAETIDGWQFTPTYGPDARPTIWNPSEWGGTIPRTEVRAAVADIFTAYKVRRMYCDPYWWQSEIDDWSLTHGEDIVVQWATYRIVAMHAALERFLTDLTSASLTHDGCTITAAHVANARKLARPGERYLLGKPSPSQKIDAAMASTLAHEAAADARADGWATKQRPQYAYVM